MEDRKSIVIIGIILFLSIFFSSKVYAYGIETHAYLTDEIINLYNSAYANSRISDELRRYIIDGSRREDDVPRWLNHFYDPVNNKGLDDPEWGRGFSSKEWAQSDSKQTTYAYKPISYVASILSSAERESIEGMDLNFTWQQAIRYYRDGKVEKAMFILGHILHLIEDASVPDHTRNDGHPEPLGDGSPYEIFTGRFISDSPDSGLHSRLTSKKPFDSMPTLSSYFNEMAGYSNGNFYSEDTIGKVYSSPRPEFFREEGGYNIAFKKDEHGNEYRLYAEGVPEIDGFKGESLTLLIKETGGDKILFDYWSRLSVKSVQVGAGVIRLFFDDIERVNYGDARLIRDDRNPITKLVDNTRALAHVASSFGKALSSSTANVTREAWSDTFGNGKDDEKLVETINIKDGKNIVKTEVAVDFSSGELTGNGSLNKVEASEAQKNTPEVKIIKTQKDAPVDDEKETERQNNQQPEQQNQQAKKETQQEQVKIDQKEVSKTTQIVVLKECSFNTAKSPSREKVIINEVAWMGGSGDFGLTSADEWIELKNVSGVEVDVSGWQLIDKAEQIKMNFGAIKNTKIKSGQFILLERTDDDSAPNVPADLFYSNTLNNNDEGLRLFDGQCNLIDEVLANPDWPAGNATSKRTMEREADLSWHTFGGNVSGGIWGTPKRENGQPLIVYTGGGGGGGVANNQQSATNNQNDKQLTTNNQQPPAKILISEIQITGGTGKTENDFIELYNPNDFQVNLNGYRLVKRTKTGASDTSIKSWTTDVYIPANEYYLWANSGYTDIPVIPDAATTATVSDDNGVAIRFGSEDTGAVIDSVAWGKTENIFIEKSVFPINPSANQSFQRKLQNPSTVSTQVAFIDTDNNANDFEIQTCPSPKAQSRSCQTVNQTPAVLLPLEITKVIYDAEGADEGKELITVNNPNDTEADLSAYSIQYLGSSGDFSDIKKKNFEVASKIPSLGIFKIGVNCHADAPCDGVELSWSEALNNTIGTVFLVSNQELLEGISDLDIADGFHYPEVTAITIPENFTVNYDENKLEMVFTWDSNPSLIYQVQEYNSPGVTIFEGVGNSFSKRIDEVGRNYKFSIRAFNENAERTELIEKEIVVPSFIKNVSFYSATHYTNQGETQSNLVEFSYDNYPFLPLDLVYAQQGIPTSGPNYKAIVFYLNSEAPKRAYLNGISPLEEDISNVLRVKYDTCAGSISLYLSLVLPDIVERCNAGGGFGNSSMSYQRYLAEGDKNLLLPVGGFDDESVFGESDYITIAFYGFERDFPQGTAPMDGIYPNFKLLATDKTRYYFKNLINHEPPQLTGNIAFNFDKQNSKLNVSWPSATDLDTLDALLTYEIKYTLSGNWQPVATSVTKIVSAGDNFSVSVRAKDDFGNYSTPVLIADWSYPAVDFIFTQNENNAWSSSFGLGYGYYGSEGNGISLQSVTSTADLKFDKVSLRMKQLPVGNDPVPNDTGNLKLSVYPDSNNQPDFSSVSAASVISNLYNPDSDSDITFHFNNPVSFSADSKYWLALEVESYSDSRGFFRNEWKNAVSNANPYLKGEAATIRIKVVGGVNSYSDFALEPNNDWYIKIGLEQ